MSCHVLHEWSKPTPQFALDALAKYGTNLFGEPLYRIVWSETRTYLSGGLWTDFTDSESKHLLREVAEYRRVPLYGSQQRWVLEKWCPPETYGSPEIWDDENRDEKTGLLTLGPFPSRGEYEHVHTFEVNGHYVPLVPETINAICYLIEKSREFSFRQKKAALEAQQAKEDRDFKSRRDDIFKDARGAFNNQAMSAASGKADRKFKSDASLSKKGPKLPKSFSQI
jgi:hypothetical protein